MNLNKLIYPLFVKEEETKKDEISSMPGIFRYPVDSLLEEVKKVRDLGIKKILIFGIPKQKDLEAKSAYRDNGFISRAISAISKNVPSMIIMSDVCLCAYVKHGHCGIISKLPATSNQIPDKNIKEDINKVKIDKKKTLDVLGKIAVSHAKAGADYVAPSAMTKGQVLAIRKALDSNGFSKTKIMAYSAKFASSFYGPFRAIADSAPKFGDRSSYQLDCKKRAIVLKRIEVDINCGADIVMVKPALAYLDIMRDAKLKFKCKLAAYNVSGEYSFVKQGVGSKFWSEKQIVREIMASIERAGADLIVTYHAKDIAKWIKNETKNK